MPFSSPLPTIVSVYNNAVPVSVVNSFTAETVILSPYIVPAGYLGINDSLAVTATFTVVIGGVGTPFIKVRIGGLIGAVMLTATPLSTATLWGTAIFQNKGVPNANVSNSLTITSTGTIIGPTQFTSSLDTTLSQAIVATAKFSGTDGLTTITLSTLNIRVIRS